MLTVDEYLDKAQKAQEHAEYTGRNAESRAASARVAANYVRMAELRQRIDESNSK